MEIIDFDSVTTRAGDDGKTSLANGDRRFKSELVFEVLGDIDELNSSLGLLKAHLEMDEKLPQSVGQIGIIQSQLYCIMGIVATPAMAMDSAVMEKYKTDLNTKLHELEHWEKDWLRGINFEGFIVPGAAIIPALCDCSRTVCRRAERHLVRHIHESFSENLAEACKYVNRLSDYLWVLGRHWAKMVGVSET